MTVEGLEDVLVAVISGTCGILATLAARRGNRRTARVNKAADGFESVIRGYERQVERLETQLQASYVENQRLRDELDEERRHHIDDIAREAANLEAIHETYSLKDKQRISWFLSNFTGLRAVVNDEIAQSAADMLLASLEHSPDQEVKKMVKEVRRELEQHQPKPPEGGTWS